MYPFDLIKHMFQWCFVRILQQAGQDGACIGSCANATWENLNFPISSLVIVVTLTEKRTKANL